MLKFGPGALIEVDQIAVVADTSLIKAVMDVVAEIGGVPIRLIFVARNVQVWHTGNVFCKYRRQRDRHLPLFKLGQRVVPDVKIPERLENPLASERSSGAQHPSDNLRLI